MALWFSLFLGNAIFAAATTALGQDERRRLIRGEESSQQVLVEVSSHSHIAHLPAQTSMLKDQHDADDESKEKDLCNENYLFGTPSTNDCPAGSQNIDRPTLCADAAASMGLKRGRPVQYAFEVDAQYRDVKPKGCFKNNNDDGALFYNTFDDPNNPVEGTPVCKRPKYKNATKDTNDGGCQDADDFHKILNEEDCRTFAACAGYCAPEEFRVGLNASNPSSDVNRPVDHGAAYFDKRPEGCFIHNVDGCVYFNVPRPDADPTGPVEGTAACAAVNGQHGNTTAANVAEAAHNATLGSAF